MMSARVYRIVDGEQIRGACRHVFVKNGGTYFLADLTVYADGQVDCWGLMTFDELRAKVASGWITTQPEEHGQASAHDLARWRFAEPHSHVEPDMLIGELLDTVDRLNQRPDSSQRCRDLIDLYVAEPTEQRRLAIREAYFAIPRHHRRGMLGDMDRKDAPVLALISDIGQPVLGWNPRGRVTTEDDRRRAVEYFTECAAYVVESARQRPAWRYDDRGTPTTSLRQMPNAYQWPTTPELSALTPDHPAEIRAFGRTYPTMTHAMLALSATDQIWHDRIAAAADPATARRVAVGAPVRTDWPHRRLAVIAALMRANFTQYPELAEILLATGDGRITYSGGLTDSFWSDMGSNWYGRMLEAIRSELFLAAYPPTFE
jgi:predicted NAD-dependent protein-ADP-ribosyltransferase YbiA (DUF1768 family)